MFGHHGRHQRRTFSRHHVVFLLVFTLLMLAPALDGLNLGTDAQELQPIGTIPLGEPTVAPPDFPIRQELPPTPTPTTEPPLRANPTAIPTEPPTLGEPPIEEPATASLTVIKRVCPPFYDPFAGNPVAECTEALDGVTFDLDNHDAGEADLQAITGATVPGAAVFADVLPGTWALSEQIPAGYDQPFLWDCVDQNNPGLAAPPFTLFNTWDLEIEAGQDIVCRWFNVENNTNHTIRVSKQVCPEGFDPTSDVWTFQDECGTALADVDFTMTTDSGVEGGTTDAQGRIEWTDVDLGASGVISLDEDIPDGYGEPVVWCVSFPEAAADPEDFDYFQVDAVDGLVSVSPALNEPYIFGCAFYNFVAPDGGEGNTVRVIKHQCPMGVVEDAGFEDYNEICTQLFDDVAFTLEHEGGSFPGITANGGEVEWTGVPIGEFTIQETVPEGFADPLVWCGLTPSISLPEQMPAAGGLVSGSIEADGSDYVCYWFNIPVPTEGGDVRIVKFGCPEGIAPSDDAYALGETCLEDAGAVTFTVAGEGYEQSLATSGGSPNEALFEDVPFGTIEISEAVPDGYGTPLVFCTDTAADGPGAYTAATVVDSDTVSWEHSADADLALTCLVFNVPGEPNEVEIHKWACPEGFDPHVTDQEFFDTCTEAMDGVAFAMTKEGGVEALDTVDGLVVFGGIGAESLGIQETIPEGFGNPYVICEFNGDWADVGAVDGYMEHLFTGFGETLVCHWFNLADGDPNDIDIHKWVCPEGTGYDEDIDWYLDHCTEALDGVAFVATSDLGISVLDTVGGQVGFGGFPPIEVGIQEEIPAAYGEPVVVCGIDNAWSLYPAPTGHISHHFTGSGETLVCHWFNIPGEPPDLTILKWTCPAGYDLHAEGADPMADCTEATNGIQFQFGRAEAAMIDELQTTGDVIDGGVFFDNLEPDVYKAVELVPDGIASVFVLECTGHLMGQLQPYPLSEGNELDEIEIDAGEHLVCHWFNVPGIEGGDLTVHKYVCSTEVFVSEVDCEIFEDGQEFDLSVWDGDSYAWIDARVTDGFGVIAWSGLAAGTYRLDEVDATWCRITSETAATPGGGYAVEVGQETVVHVYNCTDEPGKPGDTPTKYPNTGVAPVVSELPVTGAGQVTSGDSSDRSIFGPLSGIVGFLVLAGRFYFVIQRGRAERERREEEAWAAEAAARRERPTWMSADSGSALTERPAWLGQAKGETPDSRPDWMTR